MFTGIGSALTLTANFANTAGRTVSTVAIVEGVPGRNGTATTLATTATATTTPTLGQHYYYAKVTQDDGKILWSAPVWVEQVASGDTTAPSVSAASSGTSGTITLTATASDNVGVTNVEFYVDGVLKGSDATSPYSLAFNSTTVANGAHSVTAKAYDAANNIGTSTAASFTVSNATGTTFNEVESNGTVANANSVTHTITAIVGTMGNTTDKDYFAVALAANEKITLAMTGPAGNDYDLYLVDAADTTLVSSTGSTSTESLSYSNGATAKTVYVKVIAFSGSSTTATYTVTVSYTTTTASSQLIVNSGFESGATNWTASSGVIDSTTTQAARSGSWKAWMNGYGAVHTDTLYQQIAIPSTATTVTLAFWLKVVSAETTTTQAYDTLKVQLRNSAGAVLTTLATYSNLDKGASYVQKTFNISTYKGQSVQVYFEGIEGSTVATSFLVDDVTVMAQ